MERIKTQADKLWKLLSNPDTFATYQKALQVTWDILRETGLLVWLVICLVLVVFEWFWKTAVGSGRRFRAWFDGIQGSSDQLASEAGKALLTAGKNSLDYTLSQAKTQLGLPVEVEPAPTAIAAGPPAPVAPPVPTAPPAATATITATKPPAIPDDVE